jgi:peptidoglycan/xylan/chitin deacetylase (PgdA/CDA1 family)
VSSYATEGRALERARPLTFRVRGAARRAALGALSKLPRAAKRGVRIVHYHYVFDDEREAFERQLAFLAREFRSVSLSDAVERLRLGKVEGDEIAVTFDDGFRNQLDNAAPLLAEHGFRACFFLVTDLLDASPEDARAFSRERLHLPLPVEPLGWEGAERLLELGHEVGSHTRSHPDLTTLAPDALLHELTASKEELSRRLFPVRHLSAPYGERARFSERVADAARVAGYESCATAIRGVNTSALDLYSLRRDHLSARWPLRELAYFLA